MKIVIAPDSFKESLSAMEVATEIEAGFREVFPQASYVRLPVADGGEGTVEAMVAATGGRRVELAVTGPLGEPVPAFYGLTGDGRIAVIEMAAASGLMLVAAARRDPLRTTTYGVGELIIAALDQGARRFIIGIGGSATNDGGAGMLQALGVRLIDRDGRDIGFGGAALEGLDRIDISGMDARIKACRIEVACDVDNPLIGPKGASAIFGPQKGATAEMVARLDANLAHYARLIRGQLGVDVATLPGGGAAGGLGAALHGFLGAELRPGVEIVTNAVGLEAMLADADLVITGEGRIDSQSIHGKTPIGVARVARRHGKPVIGIAGCLSDDAAVVHDHGIAAVFSVLHKTCSVEEALAAAAGNLRRSARNVAQVLRLGMGIVS
ncbi:glycerate 2-kinase 1 (plasmid) [Rhodovastum atsumiense]|uniref:Glycerate kinase n=1 Tax=Rhodovastum atsumiense TaxID=504468 RepID=A0A5M6IJ88_9PROT|nr:glycerate kinase [Rhodovastum atsumiense]KAA5608323.1 glycerate kinase [Rhodovastum atsumiense]CAH2606043.1 glycerate 2-kinase 1 [Rhodovastum atsumiense]